MSKSPVAVARVALQVGQAALPPYSSKYSPQTYTQPQLFACLVLRQFFKTDYRGVISLLQDVRELREVLGLTDVPHYSTLCYVQRLLLRAGMFHRLQQQIWQRAQQSGWIANQPTGTLMRPVWKPATSAAITSGAKSTCVFDGVAGRK